MRTHRGLQLAGLIVVAALLTTACSELSLDLGSDEVRGSNRVRGSGTIVPETRPIADFDRVVFAGEGDVIVLHAGDPSLVIETDDNLLLLIDAHVFGSTLTLSTREGADIDPSSAVTYRIGASSLIGVEMRGVGTFSIDDWQADEFDVVLAGVGDVGIHRLSAERLDVDFSGVGLVEIDGDVRVQSVQKSGVGSYEAGNLRSQMVGVATSGP